MPQVHTQDGKTTQTWPVSCAYGTLAEVWNSTLRATLPNIAIIPHLSFLVIKKKKKTDSRDWAQGHGMLNMLLSLSCISSPNSTNFQPALWHIPIIPATKKGRSWAKSQLGQFSKTLFLNTKLKGLKTWLTTKALFQFLGLAPFIKQYQKNFYAEVWISLFHNLKWFQ